MNKRKRSDCDYCPDMVDNSESTFFHCQRWQELRARLWTEINQNVCSRNVVQLMLTSIHNWMTIARYVQDVLRKNKAEEREREDMQDRERQSDEE